MTINLPQPNLRSPLLLITVTTIVVLGLVGVVYGIFDARQSACPPTMQKQVEPSSAIASPSASASATPSVTPKKK